MRYGWLLGMNKWEADMSQRIVMSILMGSIIGFERRRADRPPGDGKRELAVPRRLEDGPEAKLEEVLRVLLGGEARALRGRLPKPLAQVRRRDAELLPQLRLLPSQAGRSSLELPAEEDQHAPRQELEVLRHDRIAGGGVRGVPVKVRARAQQQIQVKVLGAPQYPRNTVQSPAHSKLSQTVQTCTLYFRCFTPVVIAPRAVAP